MDNVIKKIQNAIERVASRENKSVTSLDEDGMFPQIDLVFKCKGGDKKERDFEFSQFLPTLWQNNMKEPDEQYGKLTVN